MSIRIENISVLILILIMMSLVACQNNVNNQETSDKLLAQVYNKKLYESEIDELTPVDMNRQDSTLIVNAFIEKWVRESLLMHEAERNIPNELNIDDLVRDYRSSLILHNYENYLIQEELDSTITPEQMNSFYEANKEQYQLKDPIIRCHFIKVPLSAVDLENCSHWWSSTTEADKESLAKYCNQNAEVYHLDDERWYDLERIIQHLPNNLVNANNIALQKNLQHKDQYYQYFLSVKEVVMTNQPPPLSYIENQAKKVILHQRKVKLLENKKAALYEAEQQRSNIKIYTQ